MTEDLDKLQDFLNSLKGEVISIFPNIHAIIGNRAGVNFVVIVEKLK